MINLPVTLSAKPTQFKFEGSKYRAVKNLRTSEIAKLIRVDLKLPFPTTKFSVTTDLYTGWSAINVSILEVNFEFKNPDYNSDFYDFNLKNNYLSEEGLNFKNEVKKIISQYNYDDSDSQSDYFNVNFYWGVDFDCNCKVTK